MGLFPVQPDVREAFEGTVEALADAGAETVEIEFPFERSLRELFGAWRTTWETMYAGIAEAFKSGGLDLIGDHRSELSPLFAELIESGLASDLPERKRADRVRTELMDALREVHADHDVLLTATTTRPPVENTDDTVGPERVGGEFVGAPIGWCLTYPFNLVENPSASVPAGLTDDGLPVGAQLVGRRFADDTVLAASAAIEAERPWHDAYPGVE